MKRLLVLVVFALSAGAVTSTAHAGVPCRNKLFNDWEHDGQIASTYPIACYRDALRHVPDTDKIYTSLEDDIRAAMQAAIARARGKTVASQVGHRFTKLTSADQVPVNARRSRKDELLDPLTDTTKTAVAAPTAASNGGGVPVPLLVLGAVALLLVGSGAVGLAVRHRRGPLGPS